MTDRELMQQALETALAQPTCNCNMRTRLVGDGCEVCNPELAKELAEPEPVAWMWRFENDDGAAFSTKEPTISIRDGVNYVPLYTAPPQRTPLTDEEIYLATNHIDRNERGWAIKFARAVIAKATGKKT